MQQHAINLIPKLPISDPRWRARKLRQRASDAAQLMVDIQNPSALRDVEKRRIVANCEQNNLCFYRCVHGSADAMTDVMAVKKLGSQLGLHSLRANPQAGSDKISRIRAAENAYYIPYTHRALAWHSDGYYASDIIRAFIMHCVHAAAHGGVNEYLDHELVYILLYEKDPQYVAALSHPQAFTIPAIANQRPQRSAPVFRADPKSGHLLMHYTERSQHIVWRRECQEALHCLRELVRTTEYKLSYKLAANEGVICNNVLHNRSAFVDSAKHPKRLLLRARYGERVVGG